MAVSKFHPVEAIREAYSAGQRIFGESYVGELVAKYEALPKDIEWHFIGHLQRNKVRSIVPFVSLIHSVDSLRLVDEIEKQAAKIDRVVDVLIELHIAQESSKTGLSLDECTSLLEEYRKGSFPHVRVCGLMMMGSNVDDEEQIEGEFRCAAEYFDYVKGRFFADEESFCERSWGMSDDYHLALRQRSTLIRLGTRLFGARQ